MTFQAERKSEPILQIKNLVKTYPNGTKALKNVSFEVPKGAFLSVIGLSGSGKSTLLRCINRIHEPTAGSIFFEGQDITHINEKHLREVRKNIGMVFQHFNLIDRRSVLNNVLMGRLGQLNDHFLGGIFQKWPEEWIADAHEALKIVGIADKAYVRADGLSGGQKQRVAIARTLVQNPHLLLADEPVASLDPSTSYSVMNYLRDLNQKRNITVVCNLHFLSLVRDYSTHVIALRNGEKVFEGKPTDITEQWFKDIYGADAKEVEIN
ncbi:phosphonate ABC transporter ATP-binding protein [Silvanigrella aquatica]|uniref:Phosphonate ABC transporter ATP-binding protein n=1 Tax=Silvanigrella aquatica TaxID=1915309 RepID=A0A1L4CZJ5_9BACT|nr:phosphonate ABC transporter ATP-binding protein [Silvanigrella aquatica]APJ03357.1 phosphonate ABC transporter ATP-binding protein [Silvanigrella aquatica]